MIDKTSDEAHRGNFTLKSMLKTEIKMCIEKKTQQKFQTKFISFKNVIF